MNKEQERSDAINKALKAQSDHFYGEDGSPRRSAQKVRASICRQSDLRALQEKVQILGKIPKDADANTQLKASEKRSITRALEDPDFFNQLSEIATALDKFDSVYFRQLADGLDELKDVDVLSLHIMEAIHQVYLAWMCPGISLYDWTLQPYKDFVAKRIPPTKQQMRELTIRHWAMMSLLRQGDIKLVQCIAHMEQPPEVEKLIQQQSKKLPTQNWKRFWKKAGLANLQIGKAGRPRNK
jgi:hypothetical protein